MVSVSEAKRLVGSTCALVWRDRSGVEQSAVSSVHDVTFVPLYGALVILDDCDLNLDHVVSIQRVADGELADAA